METQSRIVHQLVSCLLFLFLALSLTASSPGMLADGDPLWHMAAGDWIRAHGALPEKDPFSFTTGDYRWLDISWAWDAGMSWLRERSGWHGPFAVGGITIALTLAVIYYHCLLRSGGMLASAAATIGVVTVLGLHLRPLQVTNLLAALWLLLLGRIIRGEISRRWLTALPLTMVLWVNVHGGFIAGPVFLGAFFLQALAMKNRQLATRLFATGLLTLAAMLCNPYGIGIIEAVRRPLFTVANRFIIEWQPLTLSPAMLMTYIFPLYFLLLVPHRRLNDLPAERMLAFAWLFLGVTSIRHMQLFAILAAPLMAMLFARWLAGVPWPHGLRRLGGTLRDAYGKPGLVYAAIIACLACAVWLPTPLAAGSYRAGQADFPTLKPELDALRAQAPNARLFHNFNLGSLILYETRGMVPVFIDARTETAFPAEVMQEYMQVMDALPGWESVLETRRIDALLLENGSTGQMIARFDGRPGWRKAFTGPKATLYLRDRH